MALNQKKENIIKAIDDDNKYITEEDGISNSNDLNNAVNHLIRISKKEDFKALYLLPVDELILICITMSYNNRSYESVKKFYDPIKKSTNRIKYDDNTLSIIENLLDAIFDKKTQEYGKYLKRLGLDEKKLNDLVTPDEYAIFLKPLYLLLSFKNDYEKVEKFGNQRVRKSLHRKNFITWLKDIIGIITNYHEKIADRQEYCDKRVKLNNELKDILKNEEADVLSLIPIKKEYLDYLSTPVIMALLLYLKELLNFSYSSTENIINDLNCQLYASPFTKFLYNLGINPDSIDSYTENEISHIEYPLLETRAKFLLLLGLTPKEILTTYIYYLKTLDPSIIDSITFYLNSNILSKENIKNKISEVSTIFSKINANYETLKPILDFSNTYYNESILFEDLSSIKNRLSVLAEYNLTKNHFTFLLVNYEYLSIYDLMLEKEIPLYLFINICNTPNPVLTIKRIVLSKELDIPYETPTHSLTKDIRFEKYFVCSNEELESYYPENPFELRRIAGNHITDIKEDEFIKRLERNNRLEDVYIIGDTYISRPKLLRNLQYIKDTYMVDNQYLISSFLSNSIINQGNLLDIKKELNIQKSYLL